MSLDSWSGGAWVPWRAGPFLLAASVTHRVYVSLFHLQNGLRPNSCYMASFSHFSHSLTDRVTWIARRLRGKKWIKNSMWFDSLVFRASNLLDWMPLVDVSHELSPSSCLARVVLHCVVRSPLRVSSFFSLASFSSSCYPLYGVHFSFHLVTHHEAQAKTRL